MQRPAGTVESAQVRGKAAAGAAELHAAKRGETGRGPGRHECQLKRVGAAAARLDPDRHWHAQVQAVSQRRDEAGQGGREAGS